MLLVTLRLRALEVAQVQVLGNRQLVGLWLAHFRVRVTRHSDATNRAVTLEVARS